ncbi:hypothetical protein ACLOJK_025525 [Asimina triloba]
MGKGVLFFFQGMEFDSSLHTPFSSFAWDLHAFDALNTDMPLEGVESPFSSDCSSGYLQDAIAEWTSHCKRRRMLLYSDDQTTKQPEKNFIQSIINQLAHNQDIDHLNSSTNSISDGTKSATDTKALVKTLDGKDYISTSPSSFKHSKILQAPNDQKEKLGSKEPITPSECHYHHGRRKGGKRIAYPFAVVKPGGTDEDVTLEDINERILMRPARPVRHPVGEFACLPCVSADGPGLSGKAVVGFTRIHTQGRGTVTIIRTRG